jgi:hypothetical protein
LSSAPAWAAPPAAALALAVSLALAVCAPRSGAAAPVGFAAQPPLEALSPPGRPAPATAILAVSANDRFEHPFPTGLHFGATWIDLDGDGDLDLTEPVDNDSGGELTVWRNDGGRFRDATAALGLSGITNSRSAVWLDLDGDGDLDLYVTRRSDAPGNLLYENRGGALVLRPGGLGPDSPATDVSQAWADFDGDGLPDVYLPGIVVSRPRLLHNDGGFRFSEVTAAAGLDTLDRSLDAAWADFDDDGRPDLAIGEVESFRVYQNLGGGSFREVTPALPPSPGFVVSPSWADVDNDGRLDLYVGGMFPPLIYRNRFAPGADPATYFQEQSQVWGSGPPFGSGGTWADLDLDGDLDLLADGGSEGARLFENLVSEGHFLLDVTAAAGLPALSRVVTWHPAAADFDGDGRVDFFSPQETGSTLYRNVSQTAGDAVTLALVPARGGVPLGARVDLDLDGLRQVREVGWPASGFSFPSPRVTLALGRRRTAPWVDVRWPGGAWERYHGLHAGRLEVLAEGRGQPLPRGPRSAHPPLAVAGGADGAAGAATGDPTTVRLSCNPCREALELTLPAGLDASPIRVHDVRGRVVRTLTPEGASARWDMRDGGGRRVAPGVYFLRVSVGAAGPGAAGVAGPGAAGAAGPAGAALSVPVQRVVVLP